MEVITKKELEYLINDVKTLEELKEKLDAFECSEVENMDLYEGDIVVVQFPAGPVDAESVRMLVQRLQDTYPNNPVIALVKDIDLLIENPDEAIAMLEGMKAKIEIVRGTPAEKKIIV